MTPASGPAGGAVWEHRPAEAGDGYGELRTIADASDPALAYYVSDRPRLARDAAGQPILSLTLMLAGVPDPSEVAIGDRIVQGAVNFDVTIDAPAPAPAAGERELRPLFARSARLELLAGEGRCLAQATATGPRARAALATTLSRDDVLAVLAALDGRETELALRAVVAYRTAARPHQVRLTGRWADVHDWLAARVGEGGPVTRSDLSAAFEALVDAGVLAVTDREAAESLFQTFASAARAVVLDEGRLGRRPVEAFTIDIARTADVAEEAEIELACPLERALGGALEGRDRDAFIHLVSVEPPNGDPGRGIAATPRRVRTPARVRRDADGTPARVRLAALEDESYVTTARALALRPKGAEAHRLVSAADKFHAFDDGVNVGWLDDDIVYQPGTDVEDLPIVRDERGWLFESRVDTARAFYVPSLVLVAPQPQDDATTSPFVFAFARAGATAAGEPGLDASVQFTLRAIAPPELATTVLPFGASRAEPLPLDGVGVELELPFRDETGATRVQRFPAAVTRSGDVLHATVELADVWARLCYGALSQPGFQSRGARISVAWSFRGYVEVPADQIEIVSGGKEALTVVYYTEPPREPQPPDAYLDARTLTFHDKVGEYKLRVPRDDLLLNKGKVVVRPQDLGPPEAWWHQEPAYTQRTFVREQLVDVLVPCSDFGACYVERRPEGDVAVGCQDALRLGQTTWRQYEEIPALADPRYRVLRSLQQPGRFLVLPASYLIGRYGPGDAARAYRPAVLLYALVDSANPAANQVVVDARLEPDLPPYALARLRARLAAYAREPVIQLPEQLDVEATFAWTVADIPSVAVAATLQPGGIAVTLTSDLPHALLLRDLLTHTGVAGRATFRFADGSTLQSSLAVRLGSLTGPLAAGPLETTLAGGRVTLTNRIEAPLTVSDVLVDTSPDLEAVPVEQQLAPGAAATVTVPGTARSAWAVYSPPANGAAALEEVRAFVEDIRTNVIFLDLINHATHGVTRLDLEARMVGVEGTQIVALTGTPAVGTASFVVPLTVYLAQRVVQYRVTVQRAGGATSSPWLDWDIATAGALVSLTWDALALPDTT